jgi:hypothetical protein
MLRGTQNIFNSNRAAISEQIHLLPPAKFQSQACTPQPPCSSQLPSPFSNGAPLTWSGCFYALLAWSAAAGHAPLLAGFLIGFTLVNSVTLLFEANAAGLAVGLCAIALSLFLRRQFEVIGVCCLAVSLCLKPHDAAFIWLFLLLTGGVLRIRALQTLIVVTLVGLPAVLWVAHVSPNWRQEITSNIALNSSRGGVDDPGPTSSTNLITNSAINLQTVFAVFLNKPLFYNAATYIICALLLLSFIWSTIRNRHSPGNRWVSIAAISALTLLPIYHRHHDARMLLLAVPACAALWAGNRILGQIGTLLTFLAITLTGDLARAILEHLEAGHTFTTTSLSGKIQMAMFTRPAPLAILLMGVFFLWLHFRAPNANRPEAESCGSKEKTVQLT